MPGRRHDFRRTQIAPALALALACLGTASMVYYHLCLFIPRAAAVEEAKGLAGGYAFGNDLYQIWITTREWLNHGRDPYAPDVTREIQTGLYGRALDSHRPNEPVDQRAFPYPVYVDLLFWPGAQIGFATVRIVACFAVSPCMGRIPQTPLLSYWFFFDSGAVVCRLLLPPASLVRVLDQNRSRVSALQPA